MLWRDGYAPKKYAEDEETYHPWSGDKQGKVHDMYSQITPVEYKYYVYVVDNLLDSIVDLETQQENDNLEMLGLIGKAGGWGNSLADKLLNQAMRAIKEIGGLSDFKLVELWRIK